MVGLSFSDYLTILLFFATPVLGVMYRWFWRKITNRPPREEPKEPSIWAEANEATPGGALATVGLVFALLFMISGTAAATNAFLVGALNPGLNVLSFVLVPFSIELLGVLIWRICADKVPALNRYMGQKMLDASRRRTDASDDGVE